MLFLQFIISQLITDDSAFRFKGGNNPLQIFDVYLQYEPINNREKNGPADRYLSREEYFTDIIDEETHYTIPIKKFCYVHYTLVFIITYGERRLPTDRYIINIPISLNSKSNIMEMEPRDIKIEDSLNTAIEEYEFVETKKTSRWKRIFLLMFLIVLCGIFSAVMVYLIRIKE